MSFRHDALILWGIAALAGCAATPARWVAEVQIRGAKSIDVGELEEGLGLVARTWYQALPFFAPTKFSDAELDRDIKRIRAFYAARGFFEAKVDGAARPRASGGGVDVVYRIQEGPAVRLSAIRLLGVDAVEPRLRERLLGSSLLEVGQRYDHARYASSQQRLSEAFKQAGFAYVKTRGQVVVNRGTKSAEVRLQLDPGPRVRFGKVSFVGADGFPQDKLRRMLHWKRGDRYSPAKVDRARERLFAQRTFGLVRLEIPEAPAAEAPVLVRLSGAKLRELRFGFGVGVDPQRQMVRLLARWTRRNVFGRLATLTLELKPAYVVMPVAWDAKRHGPAVDLQATLTQPDFLATGLAAYLRSGYELAVHPGYRYHGPRGEVGVRRSFFGERVRIGVSYNLQFLDFFDFDADALDVKDTPLGLGFVESYRLGWLGQQLELDLRDDPISTRSGFYAALRLEEGLEQLGGSFRYLKVTPEVRAFVPLGTKRVVLAGRGLFGYLLPADGQNSPVTRRYALGGATSHRGFGFRRLAPQSYRSGSGWIPLGGNTALLVSAELRLRVLRLFGSTWIDLVGFFDAGDVVARPKDLDLGRLHFAAGGSLMLQTPIGTLRVALGVRINRLDCVRSPLAAEPDGCATTGAFNPDPGERFAFHLTLGEAF